MSAMGESSSARSSSGSGIGHIASPAASAASTHAGAEGVVVAHDGRGVGAERDDLGAGEGGDVDDRVGRASRRRGAMPSPSTMRPSASVLRTSTVVPPRIVDDVARALGGAARHVLGQAEVAGDRDRQAELGDGEHGRGDRGRAGHVALHRHHAGGRLDAQAARVERDALADEGDRSPWGRRGA